MRIFKNISIYLINDKIRQKIEENRRRTEYGIKYNVNRLLFVVKRFFLISL